MHTYLNLQNIIQQAGSLPASEIAAGVNDALQADSAIVITAPPGAGKSTLLPLTILSALPDDAKVLMLEPRRLAARQIAERMAAILGEPVGKTVGYRVRFENRVSEKTRIEVLTEGILTRMLVDDPTLDGVSVVIFDEFHERSINCDLALALTRQAQQIIRPDLRLVIMSATLGISQGAFFDASHGRKVTGELAALSSTFIECRGRMFDVEVVYDGEATPQNCVQEVVGSVIKAHALHEGDILVFLPGQGEIMRCAEMLEGKLGSTSIYPLYGNLSPEMQRRAIAPSSVGERKVVLATPIAETSLTIEGVRIVVDSGLCRKVVFDQRTGLSHLDTVRISLDMAAQRMGRAGRVAEGVCYRLWSKATEHRMEPQRSPEVMEADLAAMLLDVIAFGERDAESLPWLTAPPHASVMKGIALLRSLGAVVEQKGADGYVLTSMGKAMAGMPCHPRMSRMILQAATKWQKALACDIAALLEEKDPMGEGSDTDMSLRISSFRRCRRQGCLGRWARIARIAAEYYMMVDVKEDNADVMPQEVGFLVACAYPERIAMARDAIGNYRLASGDNVRLDAADAMSSYQWLAIASLNTNGGSGRVFLSAPVDKKDLQALCVERDNVSWDSKELRVVMQHEQRIGKLLLDSRPVHDADKDRVVSIICEAVKKDGLSMFDWNDDVQHMQRRVAKVREWHPELPIPDVSTEHLMATATEWLPFYLENNGRIRTAASELKRLDMKEVIWAQVPYDVQQEIERLAPSHIQVPTGSRIRLDYRHGAEVPVLSVRLQECFGMEDTPRVDGNRLAVLMELLSPGFKPVQLTQDLRSFWRNTYFEVRKELRRRYPKHYWPDNPLEAQAVRGRRKEQ